MQPKSSIRGFSLLEAMIGLAVGVIVIGGTLALMRPAADVSNMVETRAELQQNARVGLNQIATDLSQAGTGMPPEGVPLPQNEKGRSLETKRGCSLDGDECPLGWVFINQNLYSVTPGDGLGPAVPPESGGTGEATDIVTLVYRDRMLRLDEYPLLGITASGSQIDVDERTPIDTPGTGVKRGDVIVLANRNGRASGLVTNLADGNNGVLFDASDPLVWNQPSASFGNIASLKGTDKNQNEYPPTRAFRVWVVTYYLDTTYEDRPRLMRQTGGKDPEPVAEYVTDLQMTYDIFDPANMQASADMPNAGGQPPLIQKVNIMVTARSPYAALLDQENQYITLRTSVSPRNLSFSDRPGGQ